MTLSCACNDFDKGDHDSWWEPGRRSVPPPGERCCECNAALPAGEKRASILHGEVYEPDAAALAADPEPEEPEDDDWDKFDARYDAWRDRHGWDSKFERFERYTSEYRCERCEDLAAAIEDLGYCMIAPGELPDAHAEYVNERRHQIIWKQNPDGVWHPRPEMPEDRLIAEITRRWRRTVSWVRWGWRHDMQFKVWHRVMRGLGYQYHYDYQSKSYHWKRRERRTPPWLREAAR